MWRSKPTTLEDRDKVAKRGKKKYSICITHYNNAPTVRQSIESILNQIDEERFEVVVVDNKSSDGSREILRQYAASGKIVLIEKRCSRGEGRQIAFENSSGDYVIANLDLDDVFKPTVSQLIDFYNEKCEGDLLAAFAEPNVWTQNVTIGSRRLIEELGGWRNLQCGEDWDLWCRAARARRYHWTIYKVAENTNFHPERKKFLGKLRSRYTVYLSLLKLGRRPISQGEEATFLQKLIYCAAKLSLPFHKFYGGDEFSSAFQPYTTSYFLGQDNLPLEIIPTP